MASILRKSVPGRPETGESVVAGVHDFVNSPSLGEDTKRNDKSAAICLACNWPKKLTIAIEIDCFCLKGLSQHGYVLRMSPGQ
jgi:hypothetical protein